MVGVGVGQFTPHLFTSSYPGCGLGWFGARISDVSAVGVCVGSTPSLLTTLTPHLWSETGNQS